MAYEHDDQGQLTLKREGETETRYRWNRFGQLAEVELPGRVRWTYTYDAFGRRVKRQGPGEEFEYVWDGDVVLHEMRRERIPKAASYRPGYDLEGRGPPEVTHWEFDPDGFAPICKTEGGQRYLCVNDVAGNPRELVTQQGEVVWRGVYSALGALVTEESKDGVTCPVRLQGQWADGETGLFYNRFRYYDPACGRYISPDPVGLGGGLNEFVYAPSTTGWIDPFGLSKESSCEGTESESIKTGRRTWQEAGISPANARRIQNAANKTRQRIVVVGSRAAGKATVLSDWDYVMSGKSRQRGKAKSSLPRGNAGGEIAPSGRETGIDVWQDYNPNAPGYTTLDPDRPHVVFDPE
jgi:RHS repeat-associated protein